MELKKHFLGKIMLKRKTEQISLCFPEIALKFRHFLWFPNSHLPASPIPLCAIPSHTSSIHLFGISLPFAVVVFISFSFGIRCGRFSDLVPKRGSVLNVVYFSVELIRSTLKPTTTTTIMLIIGKVDLRYPSSSSSSPSSIAYTWMYTSVYTYTP